MSETSPAYTSHDEQRMLDRVPAYWGMERLNATDRTITARFTEAQWAHLMNLVEREGTATLYGEMRQMEREHFGVTR